MYIIIIIIITINYEHFRVVTVDNKYFYRAFLMIDFNSIINIPFTFTITYILHIAYCLQ